MSLNQKQLPKIWTEPVFRWAGSKRKLLPILLKNTPTTFERYVEPFCGSACLFFALNPEKSLLGDINSELIHTYRQIRYHPRIIARRVQEIRQTKDNYLRIRALKSDELSDIDRAVRFVFLNRLCFNGVYRTNKKGQFNVPMGNKTGKIPSETAFYRCSIALRNAELCDADFESLNIKKGDFIYLDPPYAKKEGRDRGEYGPGSFQYSDIDRIVKFLKKITEKKANFLFSYSCSNDVIDRLHNNWNVQEISVARHVAGFSKHRNTVKEILVSNNKIEL